MKVLVVGAGLAGVRVAEGLRDKGFTGELVLLGEEHELPYDRPPLTKQVLRGEREPIYLLPEDHGLDLRRGVTARGLDLDRRVVETSSGPEGFDQLVIATGASPRRLPGAPGLALRTLADCRALASRLGGGGRLGIVGAGLIGCEVAASARSLGVDVHVVDLLDLPLVNALGPVVAQRVRDLHLEHGVAFYLGAGVASATATSLALPDGSVLEVDAVLEAMGVRPRVDWLEGSGLELSDGIGCDEQGRAADGVWAVGDVARWSDGHGGGSRQEHWTSAADQASIVAAALLGDTGSRLPVPYWWSDQYDLKLQGLGVPAPDDEVEVVEVGKRQRPLALYSRDGRLTAAVGFSAGAVLMGLRDAVAEGTRVEELAL